MSYFVKRLKEKILKLELRLVKNLSARIVALIVLALVVAVPLTLILENHFREGNHSETSHLILLTVMNSAVVIAMGSLALDKAYATVSQKRTKEVLNHYMDADIVSEVMENAGALNSLKGEKKTIAILFADIRNFTSMSENLSTEDTVDVLNRYLSIVSECIMRNGGTLDKYMGDCVMAFWGAPIYYENSAFLASRCALEIMEEARVVDDEIREKYGWNFSFGIGINYGEAIVGNIGTERRMDYTAIGDAVNIASRLEGEAPGGSIYISENVVRSAGEQLRTTRLGNDLLLKGKEMPVSVYALEGLIDEDYRPGKPVSGTANGEKGTGERKGGGDNPGGRNIPDGEDGALSWKKSPEEKEKTIC